MATRPRDFFSSFRQESGSSADTSANTTPAERMQKPAAYTYRQASMSSHAISPRSIFSQESVSSSRALIINDLAILNSNAKKPHPGFQQGSAVTKNGPLIGFLGLRSKSLDSSLSRNDGDKSKTQFIGCWTSRKRLSNYLMKNIFLQIFIVFLVYANVFAGNIIDIQFMSSNLCETDSDCPRGMIVFNFRNSSNAESTNFSTSASCYLNRSLDHCMYKSGAKRCVLASTSPDLDPLDVEQYINVSILSFFVFEILLRMFAIGPRKFFALKLELCDGIVALLSFSIAIISYNVPTTYRIYKIPPFLVLVRVWRLKHVLKGTTELRQQLFGRRRQLESRLSFLETEKKRLLEEIEELEGEKRDLTYMVPFETSI